MKKTCNLLLFLALAMILCLPAFATDEGFDAGLVISAVENDSFTVAVPESNNTILAQMKPTLSIVCPNGWDAATVTFGGETIDSAFSGNQVTFTAEVGGTYTISKAEPVHGEQPATYTVNFDANGGIGTMNDVTVTEGEKLTLPECGFTAPEGKEFDRWDCGNPGEEIPVTRNITVKAIWKVKETTPAGQTPLSPLTPDVTIPNTPVLPEPKTPFDDVLDDAPYVDAVAWAVKNGITTGTGATTFSPDLTVTRAMAVTFLWRAMGEPKAVNRVNPFADVKETNYFFEAVLWAVEQGVTKGTSATTFSPELTCTNAHMLTFLYRTLGCPDATGAEPWYADAMNWAVAKKIAPAATDTNANCPRSSVVQFMYLALGK